jgi:hypothetical protein
MKETRTCRSTTVPSGSTVCTPPPHAIRIRCGGGKPAVVLPHASPPPPRMRS